MQYLGISRQKLQKTIAVIKICQDAKFRAKQKTSNLGPKLPYLGNFGEKFEKNYCHI